MVFGCRNVQRGEKEECDPIEICPSPPSSPPPKGCGGIDTTPRRGDTHFNAAHLDHGAPPGAGGQGDPRPHCPHPHAWPPPVSTHNGPSVWGGDKRHSVLLVPTMAWGGRGAEISMSITGQNHGPGAGTAGTPPHCVPYGCPHWERGPQGGSGTGIAGLCGDVGWWCCGDRRGVSVWAPPKGCGAFRGDSLLTCGVVDWGSRGVQRVLGGRAGGRVHGHGGEARLGGHRSGFGVHREGGRWGCRIAGQWDLRSWRREGCGLPPTAALCQPRVPHPASQIPHHASHILPCTLNPPPSTPNPSFCTPPRTLCTPNPPPCTPNPSVSQIPPCTPGPHPTSPQTPTLHPNPAPHTLAVPPPQLPPCRGVRRCCLRWYR